MSSIWRWAWLLLVVVAAVVGGAAPARANLCVLILPGERALAEADALRDDFGPFVAIVDDPATPENERYRTRPDRQYDARVLECNRVRDSNGEGIEARIGPRHVFPRNLEPRTVKGHYRYAVGFNLRYAYQLERRDGVWVVTLPIRFHWPGSRMTEMVDLPGDLAARLGLTAPGRVCAPGGTVLEDKADNREIVRGEVRDGSSSRPAVAAKDRLFYGATTACRVRRDLVVGGKSMLNHLRDYWRDALTSTWNRASFEVRPVFLECEEPPPGTTASCDRATAAELSAWTKDETIWHVHFNLNPSHRPAFKRFVGKWNNIYTGSAADVVAHEAGHQMGLDDEYDLLPADIGRSPEWFNVAANLLDFDCRQFNPEAGETYLMCSQWAGRGGMQGLYPWIITRRYAVAQEFQCREDRECAAAEYCDRGWATVGRNQCLPRRGEGDRCERPDQCVARADCVGLPLAGRCAIPASVALNGACIHDSQCTTGSCGNNSRRCQCRVDAQCGAGRYCAEGFVTIGENACRPLQPDFASCPAVGGGRTCEGGRCAWGRCYTEAAVRQGGACFVDAACAVGKCSSVDGTNGICVCRDDADCGAGAWCDRGADLRLNACRPQLARGEVCGRVGQFGTGHRCRSGTCTVALGRPGQLTCR